MVGHSLAPPSLKCPRHCGEAWARAKTMQVPQPGDRAKLSAFTVAAQSPPPLAPTPPSLAHLSNVPDLAPSTNHAPHPTTAAEPRTAALSRPTGHWEAASSQKRLSPGLMLRRDGVPTALLPVRPPGKACTHVCVASFSRGR